MQPNPILVQIGPITVYWYGVLIVSGAMLAAHIGSKLSSRNGHNPEVSWNMLLVLLFTGILGARIYHIISSWDYYRANPGQMFGLQMSGFGIFGAVWGGLIGLYFFCRHNKLRFLEWTDYIAPGFDPGAGHRPLGQLFQPRAVRRPPPICLGVSISPPSIVCLS